VQKKQSSKRRLQEEPRRFISGHLWATGQVGKTTGWVRQVIKKTWMLFKYHRRSRCLFRCGIEFGLPTIGKIARLNPKIKPQRFPIFLIIDEVTKKSTMEVSKLSGMGSGTAEERDIRVILLGSSQVDAAAGLTESLAEDLKKRFTLGHWSYKEIGRMPSDYFRRNIFGFGVILGAHHFKEDWRIGGKTTCGTHCSRRVFQRYLWCWDSMDKRLFDETGLSKIGVGLFRSDSQLPPKVHGDSWQMPEHYDSGLIYLSWLMKRDFSQDWKIQVQI